MKSLLTVLLTWIGLGAAYVHAKPTEMYRYENDDGVVVLSNSIPPELVHKGYSVVGEDGTVLRVVPRELTPAEIAERERQRAHEKTAAELAAAQARHDAELMKFYASARDVEEARDRKLQSLDNVIATTKGNLEHLKFKKQRLEEQAADMERRGLALSADLVENLKILETQIAEKEREVVARIEEQRKVSDQFAQDIERVKLLLGVAPDKTAPPTTQ